MSYDLNLVGDGELDLDVARKVLGGDPDSDEAEWSREALQATILFTPEEIDIGIVTTDAAQAERARDFEELLRMVLDLADRLDATVFDPQFGRELGHDDVQEAVSDFA